MTGQLTVIRSGETVAPHTHVFFVLDDGRELRYTDIRRFGRMLLVPESGLAEFKGHLGKEPLEISAEEFCEHFGSRRARVKALLLDQSVLRGIGNIYADESLFRARLHPARIAENLTKKQLLALHGAVRQVLADAIRLRGSSISDYVDSKRQSRRVPAPAPCLPARREAVFPLQGNHPAHDRGGQEQPFLPALPAPSAPPQRLEEELETTDDTRINTDKTKRKSKKSEINKKKTLLLFLGFLPVFIRVHLCSSVVSFLVRVRIPRSEGNRARRRSAGYQRQRYC